MEDVDMDEPTAEVVNDWWLIVRTPDGVHVWQAGGVPSDEQIEVAVDLADGRLDHSVVGRGWDVSVTGGRPRSYFHDDGAPRAGVHVHDVAELSVSA